jgi:YD repeat-containing protein
MIALLMAALAATTAATKTDCARAELVGPVRSVVTTLQSLKKDPNGSIDPARTLSSSVTYDRACMLVEDKEYPGDFMDDRHPERIDATTVLVRSNMGDKTQHERYDAAGNLVDVYTTAANGDFVEHSEYVYDAAGRIVRTNSYDADGKAYDFTTFTRDKNELIVREDVHFGDGRSQFETYAYEFDGRGNWVKEVYSGTDPDAGITTFQPLGIFFREIAYY